MIITLFIVALVSILVLEYHFDATVEVELADTYASEVQAYYLAMTGLNLAQVLLQRDAPAYDALDELWSQLAPLTSFLCISPQQLLEMAREQMELQAQDKSKSKSQDKDKDKDKGNSLGSVVPTATTERLQSEVADPLQACLRLSIIDEARKLPINALVNGDTR